MKGELNERVSASRPVITAAGLGLLWGSAALLTAGAWRYDGGLLWLGFAGLAVLLAARWLAPRNLAGLVVTRQRPGRVFAGEAFDMTLGFEAGWTGRGHARWPCLVDVEIRDTLLPRRAPGLRLPGLSPGDHVTGRLRARLYRRGRETRAEWEAVSRFPLGLFEVRACGPIIDRAAAGGGLLVCPQPLMSAALRRHLDLARFEAGLFPGIEPEPGEEFRGVRDYRGGDPLKTVHWGATARAGRLMVREWDPPAPRPVRYGLLLHTMETRHGGGRLLRPDCWEKALRYAAGLVAHCQAAGIPLWFAAAPGAATPAEIEWMRMPEGAGYGAALEWTALAGRRGTTAPETAADALRGLAGACDLIFVLSDVPRGRWEAEVSRLSPVVRLVCLDAGTARSHTGAGDARRAAGSAGKR